MKQAFLYGLKGQCTNGQEKEIDNKYRWFCRTCCKKCNAVDSRQPAIFHIEWCSMKVGDECIGLASKLYILQKTSVREKMQKCMDKYIFYIKAVRKAQEIGKGFVFHKYKIN